MFRKARATSGQRQDLRTHIRVDVEARHLGDDCSISSPDNTNEPYGSALESIGRPDEAQARAKDSSESM